MFVERTVRIWDFDLLAEGWSLGVAATTLSLLEKKKYLDISTGDGFHKFGPFLRVHNR